MGIGELMKVLPIQHYETKEWLLKKHYAKRMPQISYAFGLYINNELVGVCTYGMPPSSTLAESIAGKNLKKNVLELNRLITTDNLPKNSLSYFVSQTLKMLSNNFIIVSFADSNVGHNGYIYQATNFIYTGMSTNTSKLIDKNGNEFHFRNIGHYQQNNKLNVKLVKRRADEGNVDQIDLANYLKLYKGKWTAKQLDKEFGYKDTCSHWFRTDSGFSFPKVDDWKKLKKILKFCDKYDKVMTAYKMTPCPNEIIKKLELTKVKILPKHRYIYITGNKKFKKQVTTNLKLTQLPYPKNKNRNYDVGKNVKTQKVLF
tara:strand:- start:282 stop:1226 length:945 start_codon:yes stop_codon:yes gene_type:complete